MIIKKKMQLARSLLYFMEVVRCGRFNLAAEINGIKPANLSTMIRNLEKELGVKLLEKGKNGVVPTLSGRDIFEKAEKIERDLRELSRFLNKTTPAAEIKLYLEPGLQFSGWDKLAEINPRIKIEKCEKAEEADIAFCRECPTDTTGKVSTVLSIGSAIKQDIFVTIKNDNEAALDFYRFLVASMM